MKKKTEREITWFAQILENALSELEEYGDLHEDQCQCLREEACDCGMNGMKEFLRQKMEQLNEYWIKNIDEHRPYCSPAGNKVLTRVKGSKNRELLPKK